MAPIFFQLRFTVIVIGQEAINNIISIQYIFNRPVNLNAGTLDIGTNGLRITVGLNDLLYNLTSIFVSGLKFEIGFNVALCIGIVW